MFLIVVLCLLCFEFVAYFKGWHFSPLSVGSVEVMGVCGACLCQVVGCESQLLGTSIVELDQYVYCSVSYTVGGSSCFDVGLFLDLWRLKPKLVMEYKDNSSVDEESNGNVEDYSMVLVQIPMCNKREVRRCRSHIPSCHFDLLKHLHHLFYLNWVSC